MIRTGIWKASQIDRPDDVRGFFGGTRRVSIALYNELVNRPDDLVETLLLNYSDSRGAYKRTYRHRFENFDRACLYRLKGAFSGIASIRIHDAGVSDGRTALDFFSIISPEFPKLDYFASDFETEVKIKRDGDISIALGREGNIHEIVYPPFVFNLSKLESATNYPVNHLMLMRARKRAHQILALADEQPLETIKLFCPGALRLAQCDDRFRLAEHNLLEPMPTTDLHAIRAMNVLNSAYFSDLELERIARHFHEALIEGGFFFFGSNETPDTPIRGGMFMKTGDRFENLDPTMISTQATEIFEKFRG